MKNKQEKNILDLQQEIVDEGHTWLSAFKMINPSEEFKKQVGEIVIGAVNRNGFRKTRMTFNKS